MKRQDGFALPLTLSVVVVLLILIFSTSISMLYDRSNAANDRSSTQAEEVAKAGFTKFKTASFQNFRYYADRSEKYAHVAAKSAQCGNLLTIGLDLGRDGIGNGMPNGAPDANDLVNGGEYTGTIPVGNSTGQYKVSYFVSGSGIVLRSTGTVNGARAVVQGFLSGQNASAFSNALFAGASGQDGKNLNGGADIYGSMYVQGAPDTQTAINANGGFGIHNFYSNQQLQSITGLSNSTLKSFLKLQSLEQTDMCATVRASNGKISFGGSSTIGDATDVPSGFKGAMKGVYAGKPNADGSYTSSDWITGSGVGGATTNITTDSMGPFDLNPPPTMPKLDTKGIVNLAELPANVRNAVGSNPSWRETVKKDAELNGLTITRSSNNTVTVNPATLSCNLSTAITQNALVFGETPLACKDSTGRGFSYTYDAIAQSWILDVNGTLNISGLDAVFKKNVIVRYEGKASMLVEKGTNGTGGNVTIEGNVLPYQSFPDRDVLGIIAENNLTITGETQNQVSETKTQVVTGLFYAGNTVSAVKNAVVMGTLMGDGFDLSNGSNGGSSKTQILQVPGLEYNLPQSFEALRHTSVPSFAVYSYERK